MAKKVFSLITIKGTYSIDEDHESSSNHKDAINYDVFSRCSWVSVTYGCENGLRSSNTANEKIVGFTNKEFNADTIDLVISFEQSVRDDFYDTLTDENCTLKTRDQVHLKSHLVETTDTYIIPENINIEIFFDKKSLTAREKEIFDKDEKKAHTASATMFKLLTSFGDYGDDWNNLTKLKADKKFKEEFLSNKAFIRSIIAMYDTEKPQNKVYIDEFKALL